MAKNGTTPPAATSAEVTEKANKIFENYPDKTEVYFTSDGLAFFQECDAQNNATGLKDKKVEKVTKQSE